MIKKKKIKFFSNKFTLLSGGMLGRSIASVMQLNAMKSKIVESNHFLLVINMQSFLKVFSLGKIYNE
jgi:hypothetical protein